MKLKLSLFLLLILIGCSQSPNTPLENKNYESLTQYHEMVDFLIEISDHKNIDLEYFSKTVKGHLIPLVKISNNDRTKEKTKVLIFAQQHGNEHGGKEAVLKLLENAYSDKYSKYLEKLDLLIIPMMNPYGNDNDSRYNENDIDLNRNHLMLTENETKGLHKIFQNYLPEITLDVHEYYPFSESWMEFGYRKNYDVQFGCVTNPNISEAIFDISKNKFIPFIEEYLNKRDVSFHEYIVGGPPNKKRLRFSTIDINDGRQSFGILNSLSFIMEGKNGKNSNDNLKRRTESQFIGLEGFLKFAYENAEQIKKEIVDSREELRLNQSDSIAVRMEHYSKDEKKYKLELFDIKKNKDTVISINNFHESVKSRLTINRPAGYLLPRENILIDIIKLHGVKFENKFDLDNRTIIRKKIISKDISIDEELENILYNAEEVDIKNIDYNKYYFVPLNQLHSNWLPHALELESQIGFVQYKEIHDSLFDNKKYKILKVLNK